MAPADSSLVPTANSMLPRPEQAVPPRQRVRALRLSRLLVHTREAIPAASRASTSQERGQLSLRASPQPLTPWGTFPALRIWLSSTGRFTRLRAEPDVPTATPSPTGSTASTPGPGRGNLL